MSALAGLSQVQQAWRRRVFFATWLSYIGFYFCRKPFSAAKSAIGREAGWDATTLGNLWAAYLVSYAIGQFLASAMGTRLGPRRNVLLGMALSVVATLAMGVTLSAPVMAGLVAINGLSQATGWSGNVGTMAAWFTRDERGQVMGVWSTNFTIGALTSGWTMGWVLAMPHPDGEPWRWCFYVGASVLALVWLQFFVLQRDRPEDVGQPPIVEPAAPEAAAHGRLGLGRAAWINLLLVSGFYFFAKFIRYAVWSWSAYFLEERFQLSGARANVYATAFDLMGVLGVLASGWLSDRFFASRRAGVALAMMVAMTASAGLLVAIGDTSVATFAVLLGLVGFTLYGPDALMTGAAAIDIGGARAATFTAGVISGFGSCGPIVQELVIARMYDAGGGDLGPIFTLLFGSAALATFFCAVLVTRNRRGVGV